MKTVAIILSGGRGSRVGGADKGLLPWGEGTRIEAVISALRQQVDHIIISCNRNLERYAEFGCPLVQDDMADFQGPLAGIAAALAYCDADLAIAVPCDCPEPSPDLVERLVSALLSNDADLSYAHDGERGQYLFTAMKTDCRASLESYLADGGRSVRGWHDSLCCVTVDFSDQPGNFANINC